MESDPEQDYNNNNQGHHNKFLIKLKMPMGGSNQDSCGDHNQEAAGVVAEENNTNTIHHHITNNTPRVCPQCNKEFGSGKALGGHMRIHAEAIKKQQRRQKMLTSPKQSVKFKNEGDVLNDRPVCNVCGKMFPSMKSLFGHMRCHPERLWRGIEPPLDLLPQNNHNSSSSQDDDDADFASGGGDGVPVINLLASMPKWGEKARRGQKGVTKSYVDPPGSSGAMVSEEDDDEDEDEDEDEETEDEEEEEEKLRNAVNDLMLLKQVDCSDSSGVSTLAAAAIAAQNSRAVNTGLDQHQELSYSNSLTINNRGLEDFGSVKFRASGFEQGSKEMKRSFGIVEDEYDEHLVMEKPGIEEGGSNDHVIKNASDHLMEQEVNAAHHVVENHDVDDESDSRRTELLVMNNGRRKYLDLANQKDDNVEMVTASSKNKKVKKMKLMMDLDQEKPSAGGGSAQAAAVVSVSTTGEKYRCTTCNKSFSSHQALGGHRSSHNKFKLTIINADSGTNTNQPHQSSSVNAFGISYHHKAGNEESDQNHHQLIASPDKVNRVLSEDCATKKDSNNEGAGSSKGDHSSSTIHQCEVCNKLFPSGQALGGHKRCHWTASADQTDSQPQAQATLGMTSSGEEASTQTGGARIQNIKIDLNFPPPLDDDGEAQGGAAADDEHATSYSFSKVIYGGWLPP